MRSRCSRMGPASRNASRWWRPAHWPSSSEQGTARPALALGKTDLDLFFKCADAADAGADEGTSSAGSAEISPACSSASAAAASVNWDTRSLRRASFGLSKYGEGSVLDLAEAVGRRREQAAQNASLPMPAGATTPMPVTATRRPSIRLGGDQVEGGLDRVHAFNSSSSTLTSNSSSSAMTNSTRSRLSA